MMKRVFRTVVRLVAVLAMVATSLVVPLSGASGQQVAMCDGEVATIVGTDGRDVLIGTEGRDVMAGLGGNDVLRGMGGDDLMCGDEGRDRLFGGLGNDTLFGGTKNDIVKGDQGRDVLYGNQGNDRVIGGGGADTLIGGSGERDRLVGKGGTDSCSDRQSTFTTRLNTCEMNDVPIGYEVTGTLTEVGTGDPWSGMVVTLTDESDDAIGEVTQATTDDQGRFVLRYVGPAEPRPYDVVAGFGMDVCRHRLNLSGETTTAEVAIVYPPCG